LNGAAILFEGQTEKKQLKTDMNMKGEIKRKSLHLAAAAVPVTLDDNLFAPLFITLIVYVTGGHPAFLSGARL
jgi:hypothetical protein